MHYVHISTSKDEYSNIYLYMIINLIYVNLRTFDLLQYKLNTHTADISFVEKKCVGVSNVSELRFK